MKFDKETVLVILLSLVLIGLWMQFAPRPAPKMRTGKTPLPAQADKDKKADRAKVAKPGESREPLAGPAQESAPKPAAGPAVPELLPVTLSNRLTEVVFDLNRGAIKTITLKEYLKYDKKNNIVLDKNSEPEALAFYSAGDGWRPAGVKAWDRPTPEKLRLTRAFLKDNEPFELSQEWTLADHYQIHYRASLVNRSGRKMRLGKILVNAGAMPPLVDLSGDVTLRKVQNIDYCRTEDNAVVGIEPDQKDFPAGQDQSVRWIGLSNTYFACLLIPKTPFATGNLFGRRAVPPEEGRKAKGDQRYILGTAGKLGDVELEAGVEKSWTFTYYAGPKAITMLEILDPQAAGIMRVAWWSWLEWISQMLLKLLIWLKLHCGSYGLSIILLTVMVRACFWPITQKANSSMRRMQKLQPELKALREKYKDNQQELNRKTWQLYQQHKVNPLGGCLPILLQIPVFFALYQTLESSIELRHIPFLWATDLSRPDTIAQILGLKIHPFILMMTVLMMAQQYLTPTAGDPVQQKMLMFMPLIMLIFLYDLPAGLTLYWTVSQIISIMQLLINQHFATRGEPLKPATQT